MPKNPNGDCIYGDYSGVDWSAWGGPEWDEAFRRARAKNLREVDEASDDELKDYIDERKIKRAAEKRGVAPDEVFAVIRDSRLYRAEFIKDPKRQNLYERVAAEAIKNMPGVEEFVHYGTNELELVDGVPKKRSGEHGAEPGLAKTIDFGWRRGGFRYFASHKYTKERGGAQDNQYRDVLAFIKEANKNSDAGCVFVAIADGEYYDFVDAGSKLKKINVLKQNAVAKSGVYAVRISELVGLMDSMRRDGAPAGFG